jgi:hypothetical protein
VLGDGFPTAAVNPTCTRSLTGAKSLEPSLPKPSDRASQPFGVKTISPNASRVRSKCFTGIRTMVTTSKSRDGTLTARRRALPTTLNAVLLMVLRTTSSLAVTLVPTLAPTLVLTPVPTLVLTPVPTLETVILAPLMETRDQALPAVDRAHLLPAKLLSLLTRPSPGLGPSSLEGLVLILAPHLHLLFPGSVSRSAMFLERLTKRR